MNTSDKVLTVAVSQTITGGALTASAYVYIASTSFAPSTVGQTTYYTFSGAGLKPLVRTFLYITKNGFDYQYGIATAAADGTVSFKLAYPGTMLLPELGSATPYYLLQNTTLSDGTGQLKASGTY